MSVEKLNHIQANMYTFITSQQELNDASVRAAVCYKLLQSEAFTKSNYETSVDTLMDLAQSEAIKQKVLIYELLLACGLYYQNVFIQLRRRGMLKLLLRQLHDNQEERLKQLVVRLMYQIITITKPLRRDRLLMINARHIGCLLNIIKQWPGVGNETSVQQWEMYRDAMRILAFINEQYIEHGVQNRLLVVLAREQSTCRVFGEYFVYTLNREEDTNLLVNMNKLLTTILASPATCRFFYRTDLHVIIDILLRILRNSDEIHVIHSILHVWTPLLKNSQWRENKYAKQHIYTTLSDITRQPLDDQCKLLASQVLEECNVLLQY